MKKIELFRKVFSDLTIRDVTVKQSETSIKEYTCLKICIFINYTCIETTQSALMVKSYLNNCIHKAFCGNLS